MALSTEKRNVTLYLDGGKKVPAIDFINSLQHLQNILYHVGDYVFGNGCRTSGVFPQEVKDSCTLLFKDIKMGSVDAELIIGDEQISITDDGTLGEMAICATNDLLKAISKKSMSKEELYPIINDPHRLNKLLKEFYSICPDTGSSKTVSIGFCGETPTELSSYHKEKLHELMNKPAEEYEKEIFGWVFDLRVDQQKKIMVDTPEGQINCFYDSEIENDVREYIGKFVSVKGTMKPHNKYYAMYIDSEDSIEECTDYSLKQMRITDELKTLLKDVLLLMEREDDCYVASNDDLGILAVSNSMKGVIKEAEEQLFILYKEYVLTDDKLADSGEILSEKLKSIAGGSSGYL
ncbi:MAG: hypothetical protein PWQ63_1727 [Methanolobus sp.]|jgi:hypothetical protein|nr:hypothetical protein [Methanolobus sp.]MDK2948567.1 hypothetical protein [Methanolobus sp.]